jgi:CMP-N-acetylneuraminic acid synthetase
MILGVTPARAGSRGIRNKNTRIVAGKPLIAWTIERALESKLLDKYIVCTEDKKIAKIAREYGAEVLMRPLELATNKSLIIHTLKYILNSIQADAIVLLQCTSPIRSKDLIDKCIQSYLDSKVESLATGYESVISPYGSTMKRRQDMKSKFYGDGNIDIISSDLIKNNKTYGNIYKKIYTTREENVEIDNEFDIWLAEKILEKNEKLS